MVVSAGGNCAFIADDRANVKTAVRAITRKLLEEDERLQAVVSLTDYNRGALATAYCKAVADLQINKLVQPRQVSASFPGLKPQTKVEKRSVSRNHDGFIEPPNIDNLLLKGSEKSTLMAVVSVDGIGMGKRLIRWLKTMNGADDELFISEFLSWSHAIKNDIWAASWRKTIAELQNAFKAPDYSLDHPIFADRPLRLKDESGRHYLPCRKIYQGGDDLSFVCDARIAMALTVTLIRKFEEAQAQAQMPQIFKNLKVSAGIVFVKHNFPFSRAATMADSVRKKAKAKAAEGNTEMSVLSWWRNRQGAIVQPDSSLSLKPYFIEGDDNTWNWFESAIHGTWHMFSGSRGKFKDLLAVVENGGGADAVAHFFSLRPLPEGETAHFLKPDFSEENWFSNRGTPLLDIGELYDIHYPFGGPTPAVHINAEVKNNAG
jgi:hypothetical protein